MNNLDGIGSDNSEVFDAPLLPSCMFILSTWDAKKNETIPTTLEATTPD